MALTRSTIDFGTVETLVQDYYMEPIRNQWVLSNALWYRLAKRMKIYAGGRSIVQGLTFVPEGGGGQWWSGVDKMQTAVRTTATAAVYYRKNYSVDITLSRDEEDSVNGPDKLRSILDVKMENAKPTAIDAVGTALYNDGTDPKQVGGLLLAVKAVPGTSHTYGGITTSSTNNTWWQNQADVTAYSTGPSGTGTFAGVQGFGPISKMWSKIGRASGKRPTMIVSNWGAYTDYHNALTVNERYTRPQQDSDLAKAGFENVMYKSAAWVVDERAPHDASNVEAVWFLNEPGMVLCVHTKRNMSFDGWKEPTDQRVRIAYIDWSGELLLTERRSHGIISAVTTTATS